MQYGTLRRKSVSCCMCTNLRWQECVLRENGLTCIETKKTNLNVLFPHKYRMSSTAMQVGSLEDIYALWFTA
jgi:hypothetical protein